MSDFTVRVELHGALDNHYLMLHDRMAALGFNRFATGKDASGNPGKWHLPSGEYVGTNDGTAAEVRDMVKRMADGVKPGAWVLVTQSATRTWSTEKILGA